MKYVSTFPGQGAHYVGMLEDVDKTYLELIPKVVPYQLDVSSNHFQSSIDIQLSILIKQVYFANCLKKEGFKQEIVAGHSIGAFSAAVAASTLSLEDAIKLVYHRALKMEELYPIEKGYGIGVVIGLTKDLLQARLKQYISSQENKEQDIYLSNINSETQVAVSGKLSAIRHFFEYLTTQEAVTVKLLNVPVPSHCMLMEPVVTYLKEVSEQLTFNEPTSLYLANVTGLPLNQAEDIKEDLLSNVAHPVLWDTMSDIALELGMTCMIEYPPGTTLTKLMKQKSPHCRYIPIEQMKLDGTTYLLNKWRD